ncbi:hypothetical protein CERZMDRAFT_91908 [Cercospora zeae-maydis SCOH1-5]|uniref:Uncharacterized protein n=1 Tax=Cercospora zeae-maydis SCOH1-5 TaxID=717836 RepID=A0A6A6EZE9_9PEZI|nr:hypothetical protein CERZMDRAFT_91908 [Cercospora zeae-maydis SCOH1-5]
MTGRCTEGKRAMADDRTAMSKRLKRTANRKRRALEAELEREEQEQWQQHDQRQAELIAEVNEKLDARVNIVKERNFRQKQAKRT